MSFSHYCPVKRMDESQNAMTDAGSQVKLGGVDLNGEGRFGQPPRLWPGDRHECRQDAVRPTDGLSAVDPGSTHNCSERPIEMYEVLSLALARC